MKLVKQLFFVTLAGLSTSPVYSVCSVHDHACAFHGMGRQILPDGVTDSTTSLVLQAEWDSNADFDIDLLLPDGQGPYVKSSNSIPINSDPFDGISGEHPRHLTTHDYQITYQNNTATALHSLDDNGAAIIPGGVGCATQALSSCENIVITGNVNEGTYHATVVNYDFYRLADPSGNYTVDAYATGRGILVKKTHPNNPQEGTLTTRGEDSGLYTVEYKTLDFDPHARGVTLFNLHDVALIQSVEDVKNNHLFQVDTYLVTDGTRTIDSYGNDVSQISSQYQFNKQKDLGELYEYGSCSARGYVVPQCALSAAKPDFWIPSISTTATPTYEKLNWLDAYGLYTTDYDGVVNVNAENLDIMILKNRHITLGIRDYLVHGQVWVEDGQINPSKYDFEYHGESYVSSNLITTSRNIGTTFGRIVHGKSPLGNADPSGFQVNYTGNPNTVEPNLGNIIGVGLNSTRYIQPTYYAMWGFHGKKEADENFRNYQTIWNK